MIRIYIILNPIDKNIHPKSFFLIISSILRSQKNLVSIDTIISDLYGNVLDKNDLGLLDNDLTRNFNKHNEPMGERIMFTVATDENSKQFLIPLLKYGKLIQW